MHVIRITLLLLAGLELVDLNPLGLNSGVNMNNVGGLNSGTWSNQARPIELKPSAWDVLPREIFPTSRSVMDLYRSTQGPSRSDIRQFTQDLFGSATGFSGSEFKSPVQFNAPVELRPASQDLGVTPARPTSKSPSKGPEIDHWSIDIRLRPRSDHRIGPPNATIFVHGEGYMKPIDLKDFTHPSFNPLAFLQRAITESPQPLKLQVVTDQPYFMFFAPEMQRRAHGVFKRSLRRRIKRHHPTVLQNVLGELNNYALVPIRSSNGRTSYILLKNPRFVIGSNVLNPSSAAGPVPTVIQLAPQQPPQQSPQIMYNPGVILPAARTTYQPSLVPVGQQIRSHGMQMVSNPVPTATSVKYHLSGQPNTVVTRVNRPHSHVHSHPGPRVHQHNVDISGRIGSPRPFAQPDLSAPVMEPVPSLGVAHVGSGVVANGPAVQKTEVVETVVETQNQQAAAVANTDTMSTNSASQTAVAGTDIGGTGAITQTGAVATASQSASAGTASEVKQAKKVVTKKTTTTQVKGDGIGGAVQEVSQVIEQSVHKDAAVATAETAAASTAVGTGSSSVVSDGLAAVGGAAENTAAASSSSAAASASNSSVKSVKTIKKTTVTKTKVADPNAVVVVADPVPTAILSDKANNQAAPVRKAKTAILSENNDRRAAGKKTALIATQAPKRAAKVVNRRRKRPRKRKPTTQNTPTTTEAEFEMEEMSTTTAPGGLLYTVTPTAPPYMYSNYPPTNAPQGVAGWAGPTTEPALGPLDRINTTDVPEEIEPRPDKTPAEKRRELRKLARERARKAGRKLAVKPVPNNKPKRKKITQTVVRPPTKGQGQSKRQGQRPYQKSNSRFQNNKVWRNVITREKGPQLDIPRSRQFDPAKDWASHWAGPTTLPPTTPLIVTEAVPVTQRQQRRPPPRNQRRRQRGRQRGRRNRNRSRGTTRRQNNSSNGRSREPEERPLFRDPFTRWLYNNLESELLEKVMPLFMFG